MVILKRKHNYNYSTNPNCMDDLYIIHDELGSGGFGKVKLATHVLSGEKVAIKIIDKKAIGEDLPRVTTELDALKNIAHQNICRLFQYTETDEKFYIVMEYCNGGEMFDYIVRKARLEESEARHFFRQLVQAIAYVHSLGFAHRDLKPENLLLKEDLQLKVIDFGLCARPRNGLGNPLATCCGSPAYAAPEIIANRDYYGNEADIWSMGVLLYALICGSLPFEDSDMSRLYKKIQAGVYHEPAFLSVESKMLLRSMLTVNPRRRITIKQIIAHPWLNKSYNQPLKYSTIYDKNFIDEEVAHELAFFYSVPLGEMVSLLKQWRFDYVTATYLILLQKKEKKQKFVLPFFRPNILKATGQNNYSPTIHASLENNLDRVDCDRYAEHRPQADRRNQVHAQNESRYNCESPFEKSYAKAIELGSPLYNSPQQQIQRIFCRTNPNPANAATLMKYRAPPIDHGLATKKDSNILWIVMIDLRASTFGVFKELTTPKRKLAGPSRAASKENRRPATLCIASEKKGFIDELGHPKSVYCTPRRAPIPGIFSPVYRRPRSMERAPAVPSAPTPMNVRPTSDRTIGGSTSSECIITPMEISDDSNAISTSNNGTASDVSERGRTMRSETKSPRLRQRVFKSLERKADRMFNLLTPRRMRSDNGPAIVKSVNIVTLSVTSSKDPYRVREELVRVLTNLNITPVQNGWKVSGSKKNADGSSQMTVEYEVVLLDSMENVGVKRRRLSGDAFLYKRVCEEVLKFASLQ